jgi:hydroxymethylpyrimidine/phosphomethylpyrimidine kinase
MTAPFCVLTIAGSDSGGGAGIQADQRTIRALGGHALTTVTAVTSQDTRRVAAWAPVADALIGAQVASALAGFAVSAIKVGLLPGAGAVRAVAKALGASAVPLVIDPVLGSTSGTRFLDAAGVRALRRHLLPRASLVTPNWPEAAELSGRTVRTHAEAAAAARLLASELGCAVLVKGGHAPRGTCRDCLALPDGTLTWFAVARVATRNTHGTGCVLSSALASWLGRGAGVAEAVRNSQAFLRHGLVRSRRLDWGGGRGTAFYGAA